MIVIVKPHPDPDVVVVHTGGKAAGFMDSVPDATWDRERRAYLVPRSEVANLRRTVGPLGHRLVVELAPDVPAVPRYDPGPVRPDQAEINARGIAACKAALAEARAKARATGAVDSSSLLGRMGSLLDDLAKRPAE